LLRIAASVRFLTQPHQRSLIRYSAGGGTHYLRINRQEACLHTSSGKNRFGGSQPLKEMTMNISKLSIVLLAGIATLVAVTELSLAAQRKHRAHDAYASGAVTERVRPFHSGRVRTEALTPGQRNYDLYFNKGVNLPYPDRPYGDPDSW
jgi:hypothetical protein